MAAGRHSRERGIVTSGTHAVAQEDIYHVVFGINPVACAGEASMAKHRRRGLRAGFARFRVAYHGLVETETAMGVGTLGAYKRVDGGLLQKAFAAIDTTIEPHLEQLCQIVCVGEQAGISLYST